jgi:hypothetical protein
MSERLLARSVKDGVAVTTLDQLLQPQLKWLTDSVAALCGNTYFHCPDSVALHIKQSACLLQTDR